MVRNPSSATAHEPSRCSSGAPLVDRVLWSLHTMALSGAPLKEVGPQNHSKPFPVPLLVPAPGPPQSKLCCHQNCAPPPPPCSWHTRAFSIVLLEKQAFPCFLQSWFFSPTLEVWYSQSLLKSRKGDLPSLYVFIFYQLII